MPKINMTIELGMKLKELRLKYNVKSKDVAQNINKSAAYLSKLEKGEIKQVDQETLKEIVKYITNDENGFDNLVESIALSSSNDSIKDEQWFSNFDLVERRIPVPASLIDYIKSLIKEVDISTHDLTEYINRNEDLSDEFFNMIKVNPAEVEKNIWHSYVVKNEGKQETRMFIIIKYKEDQIEALLSGERDTCNHTTMLAVLYHLLKLKNRQDNSNIDHDALQKKAGEILREHKFYSIADKLDLTRHAKSREEFQSCLDDFDKDNQLIINSILSHICYLSDYDVKYTNEKLQSMLNNLNDDRSFALSYMAISLNEIKDQDVRNKKLFLEEVKDLVKKFATSKSVKEAVELY